MEQEYSVGQKVMITHAPSPFSAMKTEEGIVKSTEEVSYGEKKQIRYIVSVGTKDLQAYADSLKPI